ncbi:hypothetical protein ACFYNO_32880 [Kitasatospora sp. NPDC006697]|uniref:hypothetical protein n=1 Tax=Kitasatospora sp. NPDC006697 TaxID=3364020 RepID=UPI0036C0C611
MDNWEQAYALARRISGDAMADSGFADTANRRYGIWSLDRKWAEERFTLLIGLAVHDLMAGNAADGQPVLPELHNVVLAIKGGNHREMLNRAAATLSPEHLRELDLLDRVFRNGEPGAGIAWMRVAQMAMDAVRQADGTLPPAIEVRSTYSGGDAPAVARIELRADDPATGP